MDRIKKVLNNIRQEKTALFSSLNNYNHETLLQSNHDNSWSVLHVLTHLKDAESGSLKYMKRKYAEIDQIVDCDWKSDRNSMVLQMAMYLPLKFKAPKVVSNPEVTLGYEALKEEYLSVTDSFQKFLDKFDEQYIKKAIYKHPIAGKLTILQAMKFQLAHLVHHKRQIKRILNKNG